MARELGKTSHQCKRWKERKILLPGYVPISVRKWSARWSLERLRYFRCMEPLSAAARQIRDPSDGLGRIGLPAENYAIKMGVHPAISTESNIKNIKRQINEIAAIYDWDMEVNTTDPAFYKWTQWIFVQMFKKRPGIRERIPDQLVPVL